MKYYKKTQRKTPKRSTWGRKRKKSKTRSKKDIKIFLRNKSRSYLST